MTSAAHKFSLRVYYEDTDLAGIVYYANYLKYIERARSELLRELGISQAEMKERDGLVFVVARVEADYVSPARYDDELVVETRVKRIGGARMELLQDVLREGDSLFRSVVTIACLDTRHVPRRIPPSVRDRFANADESSSHKGKRVSS